MGYDWFGSENIKNTSLYLTHGCRTGCRAFLYLLNRLWWLRACCWVSLWGAPGLGSQIPLNGKRGAPHFVCSPRMAPAEIMHCRPLWMSPSGQHSGPVASTWSGTVGQRIMHPLPLCWHVTWKEPHFFVQWKQNIICKRQQFTCFFYTVQNSKPLTSENCFQWEVFISWLSTSTTPSENSITIWHQEIYKNNSQRLISAMQIIVTWQNIFSQNVPCHLIYCIRYEIISEPVTSCQTMI